MYDLIIIIVDVPSTFSPSVYLLIFCPIRSQFVCYHKSTLEEWFRNYIWRGGGVDDHDSWLGLRRSSQDYHKIITRMGCEWGKGGYLFGQDCRTLRLFGLGTFFHYNHLLCPPALFWFDLILDPIWIAFLRVAERFKEALDILEIEDRIQLIYHFHLPHHTVKWSAGWWLASDSIEMLLLRWG